MSCAKRCHWLISIPGNPVGWWPSRKCQGLSCASKIVSSSCWLSNAMINSSWACHHQVAVSKLLVTGNIESRKYQSLKKGFSHHRHYETPIITKREPWVYDFSHCAHTVRKGLNRVVVKHAHCSLWDWRGYPSTVLSYLCQYQRVWMVQHHACLTPTLFKPLLTARLQWGRMGTLCPHFSDHRGPRGGTDSDQTFITYPVNNFTKTW